MVKIHFYIPNQNHSIPAVLWGGPAEKLIIEIHGNLSNKEDTVISEMARKAVKKGCRALSFDLPMHGDRANEDFECNPENCVGDLMAVYQYARSITTDISLFACSMGAYFSLLAYHDLALRQALFLSPVVDMEHIIRNMMENAGVTEDRLKADKKILVPGGPALDWDYFSYVRTHPVTFDWKTPTAILYGSDDFLTSREEITSFAAGIHADLQILEHGEHFFHTEEQLGVFSEWADDHLKV
jgi:pimeloyl-ACP methyl ester carboxylesterase